MDPESVPESWTVAARELVASWPPLTEEQIRGLTLLALAHRRRVARERRELELAQRDVPAG